MDGFIRRVTWSRADKLWAVGSTLFYALPCLALMFIGDPWVIGVLALSIVAFGVANWRIRARDHNHLLAEITEHGIRFREQDEPIPWESVILVGLYRSGGGTFSPSHDHILLQLADGRRASHRLDERLRPVEVRAAIARLAPQIPIEG